MFDVFTMPLIFIQNNQYFLWFGAVTFSRNSERRWGGGGFAVGQTFMRFSHFNLSAKVTQNRNSYREKGFFNISYWCYQQSKICNSGLYKIKFWTWCKFSCKSPNVCILLKLCCPFIFTSRHRNLLVLSLWKPFRRMIMWNLMCTDSPLYQCWWGTVLPWFKAAFSEQKRIIFKMCPKTRTEKQKQHCLPFKMLAAPKVN